MSDESGIYLGVYTGVQAIVLGDKKTPFLALNFDITHKAGDGEWLTCGTAFQRGIRFCVSDGVWNSVAAKTILLNKLRALNFNGDFTNPGFDTELLAAEGGVQLKCEYDGKYNNWDFAEPLTEHEIVSLDTQTARVLNARYKTAANLQTPPASPPQSPPTKPSGDDVPPAPSRQASQPQPQQQPQQAADDPFAGDDIPY